MKNLLIWWHLVAQRCCKKKTFSKEIEHNEDRGPNGPSGMHRFEQFCCKTFFF
jgi:hypothetical protein